MKFIEWMFHTVQFLNPMAYSKIKEEQKRRSKESEPPFEKTWYFQFIQKPSWGLIHYNRTGYKPNEVIQNYIEAMTLFVAKAEEFKVDKFISVGKKVRLSGSTLVIDEKYAINYGKNQIYVHKKQDSEKEPWALVYRTNWLMKDIEFVGLLSLVRRTAYVYQPDLFGQNQLKTVKNTSTAANNADIN